MTSGSFVRVVLFSTHFASFSFPTILCFCVLSRISSPRSVSSHSNVDRCWMKQILCIDISIICVPHTHGARESIVFLFSCYEWKHNKYMLLTCFFPTFGNAFQGQINCFSFTLVLSCLVLVAREKILILFSNLGLVVYVYVSVGWCLRQTVCVCVFKNNVCGICKSMV